MFINFEHSYVHKKQPEGSPILEWASQRTQISYLHVAKKIHKNTQQKWGLNLCFSDLLYLLFVMSYICCDVTTFQTGVVVNQQTGGVHDWIRSGNRKCL